MNLWPFFSSNNSENIDIEQSPAISMNKVVSFQNLAQTFPSRMSTFYNKSDSILCS